MNNANLRSESLIRSACALAADTRPLFRWEHVGKNATVGRCRLRRRTVCECYGRTQSSRAPTLLVRAMRFSALTAAAAPRSLYSKWRCTSPR